MVKIIMLCSAKDLLFMHTLQATEKRVFLAVAVIGLVQKKSFGGRFTVISTKIQEPEEGFEPTTYCLQNSCSAPELLRHTVRGEGFEPP